MRRKAARYALMSMASIEKREKGGENYRSEEKTMTDESLNASRLCCAVLVSAPCLSCVEVEVI
jgi:hypothetical protein